MARLENGNRKGAENQRESLTWCRHAGKILPCVLTLSRRTYMYAIVKTGGKQYKVAPGDKLNIEKIDAEVGAKVELEAICVVDGAKVEADPAKAADTKVTAVIVEQFKAEKQLVFKFHKRKNYKRLRGHRQRLTRVQIESIA